MKNTMNWVGKGKGKTPWGMAPKGALPINWHGFLLAATARNAARCYCKSKGIRGSHFCLATLSAFDQELL